MVGHRRSWLDTHYSLRACGITGVTQWTVHYIKRKRNRDACMHRCKFIYTLHTWLIRVHWFMNERIVPVRISTNKKYMINTFLTPCTNRKLYIITYIFLQLFQGILFKFFFWKSLQRWYIRMLMYIHWVVTH